VIRSVHELERLADHLADVREVEVEQAELADLAGALDAADELRGGDARGERGGQEGARGQPDVDVEVDHLAAHQIVVESAETRRA